MMNVLGLSLVLTSLAAAGVFSPTPEKQAAPSTIVKDGHRVVVVEYDKDGHQNTKISISPEQKQSPPIDHMDSSSSSSSSSGGILNSAKDKIKEAASVLPNIGQGISNSQQESVQDANTFLHAPKELICDAYGRCKHKIAGAMGKAKDKISDAAQEVIDKEKEMIASKRQTAREVGNGVADAVGKAKDKANEYTQESLEKAKDKGQILKEHVVRNVSETRDSLRNMKDALKRGTTNLGRSIMESLQSSSGVANLLGFATAYGMCVWVTFISSYVLSRAMPRQQFAVVQSKIYPVYFRAMAYAIAFSLLGHLLAHRKRMLSGGTKPEILQAFNLLASLFTVLLNSLYLEPRATKLMFERMKMEKEEGRGRTEDMTAERSKTLTEEEQQHHHTADPKDSTTTATASGEDQYNNAVRSRIMKLNDKLKKLNSYSSILNILNLMSLTWHLVYLVQRLHQTC